MGITFDQLSGLVTANPEYGLAMALRALNVPRSSAAQMMLFVDTAIGSNVHKLREFTNRYEAMQVEYCKSQFRRFGASFAAAASPTPQHARRSTNGVDAVQNPNFASALQNRRDAVQLTNPSTQFGKRTAVNG